MVKVAISFLFHAYISEKGEGKPYKNTARNRPLVSRSEPLIYVYFMG